MRSRHLMLLALIAATAVSARAADPDDDPPATLDELVAALYLDERKPENRERSSAAIAELPKRGEPAVRAIVRSMSGREEYLVETAAYTLQQFGAAAVAPVRAEWPHLTNTHRWWLMRFRGRFDYEAALPYALASLESADPLVQTRAAQYLGRYREPNARDPLLRQLNAAPPRVRWEVVEALGRVGGEGVGEALVALLSKDSWAAKGDGLIPPPGSPYPWWPDGRTHIVRAIQQMRFRRASPALVRVLNEKPGRLAYLGHVILPALGDIGAAEATPEIERIIRGKDKDFVHSSDRPKELREKAEYALRELFSTRQ